MTLAIVVSFLIVVLLAAAAGVIYASVLVVRAIPELIEMHCKTLAEVAEAHSANSTAVAASLRNMESVHATGMARSITAHADVLKGIADTHGQAADHLAAATAAHVAAAGSNADSTEQLKQAAEQLKTLLADSNLFAIREHLSAIKTFMLPRS
jgi:ABC-type protease/lipase transport system fused ATPase/permease subunit